MDKRTYHNKSQKISSFTRGFNDQRLRGIEYDSPEDYFTHQDQGNRAAARGLELEDALEEFEENWLENQ